MIRKLRWRIVAFLITVIALNVLIFAAVSGMSTPQLAYAQDGGDEGKQEAMDFYPSPFEGGAMAFSLRDPWPKTDLTFYFHNCPSTLDCALGRDAVRQGFNAWVQVSALTFTEVFDVSEADIEVTWTSSDPEGALGEPGGVLAYNYFPRYGGDMFIDDTEPWTVGDKGAFDLVLAATHEIGHGIGLDHSEFKTAIMYAYAGNATQLGDDDVQAIQALYGPPNAPPPTNTTNPDSIDQPTGNIPASTEVDEVEGFIDNRDSYDIWDLDVEAGVTVTLTMTSTGGNLDPYVGILNLDGSSVLAENDNWVGNDARVVHTFDEAGTYSVVATRFGFEKGLTQGTYTLTAEFSRGGGGDDPNANIPPAPQTTSLRITNFAGTELCEIYFSPSDSTEWGTDQIASDDPLQDNFYYEWEIEPNTYDIQVWDCFGNKLEKYEITANRPVDVQIFQDHINVIALETETTTTTDSTTLAWRVSNYATVEICAIYFNPSTETEWGDNQIADEPPLAVNFYYEWQLEVGVYDLRVEDCSGGFLELYNITFTDNVELAVSNTEISARPLR